MNRQKSPQSKSIKKYFQFQSREPYQIQQTNIVSKSLANLHQRGHNFNSIDNNFDLGGLLTSKSSLKDLSVGINKLQENNTQIRSIILGAKEKSLQQLDELNQSSGVSQPENLDQKMEYASTSRLEGKQLVHYLENQRNGLLSRGYLKDGPPQSVQTARVKTQGNYTAVYQSYSKLSNDISHNLSTSKFFRNDQLGSLGEISINKSSKNLENGINEENIIVKQSSSQECSGKKHNIDIEDVESWRIQDIRDVEQFLAQKISWHPPMSRINLSNLAKQFTKIGEIVDSNFKDQMVQQRQSMNEVTDQFFEICAQQICIDCKQKGTLIKLLWKEKNNYCENLINQLEEFKQNLQRMVEVENQKFLLILRKNAGFQDEKIDELQQENKEIKEKLEQITQDQIYYEQVYKKLRIEVERHQTLNQLMKRKLVSQIKEIQRYQEQPNQKKAILESHIQNKNQLHKQQTFIKLKEMEPTSSPLVTSRELSLNQRLLNTETHSNPKSSIKPSIFDEQKQIFSKNVQSDNQKWKQRVSMIEIPSGIYTSGNSDQVSIANHNHIQIESPISEFKQSPHRNSKLDVSTPENQKFFFDLEDQQAINTKDLNNLVFTMNMERIVEVRGVETQVEMEFKEYYMNCAETQTNFSLISPEFDQLFSQSEYMIEAARNVDFEMKLGIVGDDQVEREIKKMLYENNSSSSHVQSSIFSDSDFRKISGTPQNHTFNNMGDSDKNINESQVLQNKVNLVQMGTSTFANLQNELEPPDEDLDSNKLSKQNEFSDFITQELGIDTKDLQEIVEQKNNQEIQQKAIKNSFVDIYENRDQKIPEKNRISEGNQRLDTPTAKKNEINDQNRLQVRTKSKEDLQFLQQEDSFKNLKMPGDMKIEIKPPSNLDTPRKNTNYTQPINIDELNNNKNDFLMMFKLYKTAQEQIKEAEEKIKVLKENVEKQASEKVQNEKQSINLVRENQNLRAQLEAIQMIRVSGKRSSGIFLPNPELLNKLAENQENNEKIKPSIQQRKGKREKNQGANKRSTGPVLGKKVNIEYEFQKTQNTGRIIIEKIKNNRGAKLSNYMTSKTVLKQIFQLFTERINVTQEKPEFKQLDLATTSYNYFMNQYGIKKIADQKFLILVLSIKKHVSIFRLNLFAQFLNLLDVISYSTEDLNKYIEVLDFVMNFSQAGSGNFVFSDSEQKLMVPYIRVMHYISTFGDARMTAEQNKQIRQETQNIREIDPVTKQGVVDFDYFFVKLLNIYHLMVNRAKTYVINAFAACDLDGNQMCNLKQWLLLNRHIEPEKISEEELIEIFYRGSDLMQEGEQNLSFNKFAALCVQYDLFQDETQDLYLGIGAETTLQSEFMLMKAVWPKQKAEILERFSNMHPQVIEKEEVENWVKICHILDDKIKKTLQQSKPFLIAFKILDKESYDLFQESKLQYEEDKQQ